MIPQRRCEHHIDGRLVGYEGCDTCSPDSPRVAELIAATPEAELFRYWEGSRWRFHPTLATGAPAICLVDAWNDDAVLFWGLAYAGELLQEIEAGPGLAVLKLQLPGDKIDIEISGTELLGLAVGLRMSLQRLRPTGEQSEP